jgi:hypothetical protein
MIFGGRLNKYKAPMRLANGNIFEAEEINVAYSNSNTNSNLYLGTVFSFTTWIYITDLIPGIDQTIFCKQRVKYSDDLIFKGKYDRFVDQYLFKLHE